MIYKEAVAYIKTIERGGSDYGIERMRKLLDLMGSPDKNLKIAHIAGTNGKGSVSAYLTAVSMCAGYKVGTYNSPSVFSYNERFLINGKPISDDELAEHIGFIRDVIDSEQHRCVYGGDTGKYTGENFRPTAFEIETAAAFRAFEKNGCDFCVVETGLGGRWDATNAVFNKELAVITAIGLDHCALLGNTLSEIAAEKAAIINGDAVTFMQSDEIMRALEHPFVYGADGVKIFKNCNLMISDEATSLSRSLKGQMFLCGGKKYEISMLGKHQLTNAAIAIKAVEVLREKGFDISETALKDGLKNAVIRARFEIINMRNDRFALDIPQNKLLILDGAHNPQGADALAETVKEYLSAKRINLVFGVLADKDYTRIAQTLAPLAETVFCITPSSLRALDKERLFDIVKNYCQNTVMCDGVRTAVERSLKTDAEVTLLCGSLTLFHDLAP